MEYCGFVQCSAPCGEHARPRKTAAPPFIDAFTACARRLILENLRLKAHPTLHELERLIVREPANSSLESCHTTNAIVPGTARQDPPVHLIHMQDVSREPVGSLRRWFGVLL